MHCCDILDGAAPDERTPFEKHLADEDALRGELQEFATRDVAVCVWQGAGAFRRLFKFLATRFLLAPDHVLDCERMHARWNWLNDQKRGMQLPLMNAWLRLRSYLEQHAMEFPCHRDLLPHLVREAAAMRVAHAEVVAREDIAPGYRRGFAMLERFNLRVADLAAVVDGGRGGGGVVHVRTDFEGTGSVYLRNTFMPRRFYHAPTLGRGRCWFYVLENKVLPGREARHATDAQTRPLVVCFFEQAASAADEVVVQRTDRQGSGMVAKTLTPAELALHLGFVVAGGGDRSALEVESLVERAWMEAPRLCYTHSHVAAAGDLHTYQLKEPMDAEDAFWQSVPAPEHTKYAIARHLERVHGWDRARLWKQPLPQLRAALDSDVPPWDAAVAAVAPAPDGGRGRGRGGVLGVARGRGRGGGGGGRRGRGRRGGR